jgi:tRNA(fMet)-specific endonuclease VapC
VPVVLDTDHLSVLQWQEQPAADRLLARLDRLPPDDIATTIVSFQEQVEGWLAYLKRAAKPEEVVRAYAVRLTPV